MLACVHACIHHHAYVHACMHTYVRTYMRACDMCDSGRPIASCCGCPTTTSALTCRAGPKINRKFPQLMLIHIH